jgi:hypothetical protein
VAENEHTHVSEEQARAGDTPHKVRYVLGISLVLVLVAFVAVYFIWQ